MRVSLAIEQWREGAHDVRALTGRADAQADAVIVVLVDELRRRLGGAFTVDELVDLYEAGTGWALDLAARRAPEDPSAWDSRVIDAAFYRYLGQAQDWGGGRRTAPVE